MEDGMELRLGQEVGAANGPGVVRVMSYNIRIAPCAEDDYTQNAWQHRLPKVSLLLEHHKPDIVGLQEASSGQIKDLAHCAYTKSYAFLSWPISAGGREVDLAIMYNAIVCEPISSLYVQWFTADGSVDIYDGSGQERCVIYAKFRSKMTGSAWWFMTTHFDHGGPLIRARSAATLMEIAASCDAPVIITGDFNCFPQAGGKELYEFLAFSQPRITDSALLTQGCVGPVGTWMGWDYDQYHDRTATMRYDHIFISQEASVIQYGVLDDRVWDRSFGLELYPSDHRPVIVDLQWKSM